MKYGWNVENELTFGELSRDFYYANLLVDNIMRENVTDVQHLLESKKANPNTVLPELGVAPLHLLAGLENEDFSSTVTLQAILRSGGDPNVRSEEGLTPVHVAAMWGRCKVLEILLVNGGDPELIDYKLFLNAEEYAIKEQQWKAYGVLSTFFVMLEGKHEMDKDRFLRDKSYESEVNNEFPDFPSEGLRNKHLLKLEEKTRNYADNSCSSKGIKNMNNGYVYSNVRKIENRNMNKKYQTNKETQSDRSKNPIQSLKLKGFSSGIKRQLTGRKNRKIDKKNQTDDESRSDRSNWSKNTITSLMPNEGIISGIKIQPTVKKNIEIDKNNQINDESHSDRSDWSQNTVKSLKPKEGFTSGIKRQFTGRKNRNVDKKNQTNDESYSDRSDWSQNTVKSLKPKEGFTSGIKRQLTGRKNRNVDKNNQTNGESHSDRSDWSQNTVKSSKLNEGAIYTINKQRRKTNIYESSGTTSDDYLRNKHSSQVTKEKEKCNKLYLYGDAVSESCDWIRKRDNSIKLDKYMLDSIKNQRLRSKIYQTKGLGEDPLKEREKIPPLYEECETCDWVDPRNTETFDESSLNKIKIHRTRTTTYKSEDLRDPSNLHSGPKLPKRNRKTRHRRKEDSEMYLCGYTESSIRPQEYQQKPRSVSSTLSDLNSSDFDNGGVPNQRMLCKMSRIFLFMLKKRHIYQKIK